MSYLITQGRYAGMTAKANNRSGAAGVADGPGIVTTTAVLATDIIHLVPVGRSFYVIKLMWYQVTGVNMTLVFGTLSNAAVPAMVQMLPTQLAITGIPGGLNEEDLVGVEFMLNSQATPNGWDGSLWVESYAAGVIAAGVQISAEVAEKA